MKAILILYLLATFNCDILSIVFCIIGNEKVKAFATEVITKIKKKDWASLPLLVISNFNQLKDAVVSCIGQKQEEEVILKQYNADIYLSCINTCTYENDYSRCVNQCYSKTINNKYNN